MSRIIDKDGLHAWVLKLQTDIEEDGAIQAYTVYHSVAEEGLQKLCTVRAFCGPESEDARSTEAIVDTLWTTAENDADTRVGGMPQRYVVHAYRADPEEPDQTISFIRTSQTPLSADLAASSSEPANDKGVTAQMMRHTENANKLMIGYAQAVTGRLAQENERLHRRVEESEERRLALALRTEDLADRQFERDLRRREWEQSQEMKEKFFEALFSLAPLLVTKFMGDDAVKGMLGSVMSPRETPPPAEPSSGGPPPDVAAFMKTLDFNDLRKVTAALGPEKSAELLKLYESYRNMNGEVH